MTARVRLPSALAGLLFACSTPEPSSTGYVTALRATTFEEAWAACAGLPARDRGDCQQLTVTRFQNFTACDQVEAGVWREECLFTAAEARVVAADRPGALAACGKTRFVANCEQHVLEAMAGQYRSATAAELAAAWKEVEPLTQGKNAQLDMWRSWHRMRIQAGVPFEKCPSRPCRTAQQLEVVRRTEDLLRHQGCERIDILTEWEPDSDAARWAASAVRQRCPDLPTPAMDDAPAP